MNDDDDTIPPYFPSIRIWLCGPFQMEWIDPTSGATLSAADPTTSSRDRAAALSLLALLLCQPNRQAHRDWIMEQFWPEGRRDVAIHRLENIFSCLRRLLRPPSGGESLLRSITGKKTGGPSYCLEAYPKLWVDTDALTSNIEQACRMERFGDDPLPFWQRAFDLLKRGLFLVDDPYDPYASWVKEQREYLQGYYRQCVHALARLYIGGAGETGKAEALLMLRTYWQQTRTDQDALRPLLELLGEQERYQEAEEYYHQLLAALADLGPDEAGLPRVPDARTCDIRDYLRTKQIQRERSLMYSAEENKLLASPSSLTFTRQGETLAPFSHSSAQGLREADPIRDSREPSFQVQEVAHRSMRNGPYLPLLPLPELSLPQFWNVPYQRNPYFTGREDVLMHLHDLLTRKQIVVAVTQHALCGLGGIGKTQTVLEYIYRYGSEYQAIFWIKADTRENLFSDFLSLAQLLVLPERDAQDQAVVNASIRRWLQEHTGWLLVFDNADDLEIMREVLPTGCQGHVLLTTRAQAMGRVAHRLEIEEMSLETGALFLLRRAGLLGSDASLEKASEKDRISAERLVQELGGLPLALDQAGAYIEEASLGIEEYRELYQQQRYVLLQRRGGLVADHPEPVATTWTLSFTCVEQMDRGAADLLRFCAFLNPDAIPEEVFTKGAALSCPSLALFRSDRIRLHQAIEVLRKFSLVRRSPETRLLSIHRLVQISIQESMDQETRYFWAKQIIQAVSAAFPGDVTVSCWTECQRLLPHVQMCAMLVDTYHLLLPEGAKLLNQAGYYLRERALYQEAEAFYKKALDIREHVLGALHLDTAQVLYNLARLYYDLGQYGLCERLHLQSLEIREQAVPTDHLALALSLNSLAFLYYIQEQNFNEAERLYQRALPLFNTTLGMDHPKTAHCLSNLALLYVSQGKDVEAEQLLLRVMMIRESRLGPLHLDTARSLQNLAWFYIHQRKQERYAEAKQLLQRSLTIRETHLGPEHPQVAMSLHHLALWCEAQGDNEGAQRLYQQVLTIRRMMMGDDNPKVLLTEESYAVLLRKMGLYEKATQLEEHLQAVHNSIEAQSKLKNAER